jgi:hypothetical protein
MIVGAARDATAQQPRGSVPLSLFGAAAVQPL